jgi:ATP-dependent RNA/DNA helicase IGHMBP2
MSPSMDDHFAKLRSLIDFEREEEKSRLAEAHRGRSVEERVALGFALDDLTVADESSLAGRPLVSFSGAGAVGGSPDLGGGGLRVGDVVRITRRRVRADEEPTGVVAKRSWTSIAVAFDEPVPDWTTDGRVVLELVANDVTHSRLADAISRFADARDERLATLRAILVGERKPAFRRHPDLSSMSKSLNAQQAAAVRHALSADELALVHGPPGTGKTVTLAEVARLAAAAGERVLAAAASNHAVDNLVERLAEAGLRVVRVGHPARVAEAILSHTLDVQLAQHERSQLASDLVRQALDLQQRSRRQWERGRGAGLRGEGYLERARDSRREAGRLFTEARRLNREAAKDILDRAQVICATATGVESDALALAPIAGRGFDLAVFDEATQATEPATLAVMARAQRIVLAGDHQQLPPTVLSEKAARGGLGVSLFERMLTTYGDELRRMLVVQHRMNETIMRFPSRQMYRDELRAHPSVANRTIGDLDGVRAEALWRPVEFLDTAGKGFDDEAPDIGDSRRNPGEAELVATQARNMMEAGVSASDIAVITPYAAQAQLLRGLLGPTGPEVDTVDGFQGREKEAVVVSLTRSNSRGEIGFLADVRRMNVAVTRARRRLVVVGDGGTIGNHDFYGAFIEYANRVGGYRSVWDPV